MVGVVPLPAWVIGVPSRTTWCTAIARSRRMIAGPTRNATSSAVTNAPAARKVM
jgi:hypothetical protein